MKKLIASLVLAVLSIGAHAAADDVIFQQRNSTDTATVPKLPPHPTSGFGLMSYDGTALTIGYLQVGPGLSVSGGVIDVVPGGAPTWASITGKPTSLSGYGITDAYPLSGNPSGFLTGISGAQVTAALGFAPYSAANPSGFITSSALTPYATSASVSTGLAGKFSNPTGTTAQYIRGDGSVAAFPAAAAFNFSQPAARTLAASTSYQATDNTKAAVIYPSYACQNATQVLASSGCTLQVRIGTSALTCSTGTVYYTQSLTVNLGVLITQNSTNPVPIFVPIGGHFILCPTTGTFTITAVEQSAG